MLVDGHHRGRWQGRTRTDKLVFFDDPLDRLGELVDVEVTKTSPWSLQGETDGHPLLVGEGVMVHGH